MIEQGALGLKDEEFWTAAYRTQGELKRRLSSERFLGIVLDAPRQVPLDGRQELPLVGCYAATFEQSDALSFDEHALVVVNTPEGCWAERVHEPRVRDTSLPAPEGLPPRGRGRSYRMFKVELAERFDRRIPFQAGTGYASVILGDQVSNRVAFRFQAPAAGFVDPAVAEFLTRQRAEQGPSRFPPAVSPPAGQPLPSYRPLPESPPPPPGPGFAVRLPAQASSGGACVVHVTYRLPVPAERTVRSNPRDPDWGVGDPEATAVLPVGLLLTGDRLPGPYLIHLEAAVYAPIADPLAGADAVVGHLALDLLQTDALRLRVAQGYHLYVLSGEHLAGPFPLELR